MQGRLTKDEFDLRVGQTLVSRTYAELATLTADIPAGMIGTQPLRKPARAQARPPMNNGAKSGVCALIAAAALVASLFSGDGGLFFFVAVSIFMSWLVAGAQMLDSRHEKRSRGQQRRQPTPRAGGQKHPGSQHLPPGAASCLTSNADGHATTTKQQPRASQPSRRAA